MAEGLRIDVSDNGDSGVVVVVAGEVDMSTAEQLRIALLEHRDRDITLNLAEVGFLDSSGLSVLVSVRNALVEAGHTLQTTGEADNIRTVLEVTGLFELLHPGDAD